MEYVTIIVGCAFLVASIVNLIGPRLIRAEFKKWGYPDWLRMSVAIVEFVGASSSLERFSYSRPERNCPAP